MKNIPWKRIAKIGAWACSLAGLFFLLSFASKKQQGVLCKTIHISMLDSETFVTKKQVLTILNQHQKTLRKKLDSLDIDLLENAIRQNPFVDQVNLSLDLSGQMNVKVWQKHPVLVVRNLKGQRFFVDRDGRKMPFFAADSMKFLNVSGNISEVFSKVDTLSSPELKSIFVLSNYLAKYSVRKRECKALQVDENKELEFIPADGSFTVDLGDTSALDEKFEKLDLMYSTVFPREGFDKYSSINLKFADQMVCLKRQEENPKLNNIKKLTPQ